MTAAPTSARALLADSSGDRTQISVRDIPIDDLGVGDTLIAVNWSSVNYKDGLASSKNGKVARIDPIVPGIDLAGTVVESADPDLAPGTSVLVHGYDVGVAHHGGYAEYARVPAGWVVPLPPGLTEREAMTIGTAGFTAALSVIALEDHGVDADSGPVVVTGATGGVGSVAVSILAARGYQVTAASGKADAAQWLRSLGAVEVVDRSTFDASKPLRREAWAGAVDSVGGDTLAGVLASTRYGGAVAASGNTGGASLPTTVFPFILRAVTLVGIDSVQLPLQRRREVWDRLARDLRPPLLDELATDEVTLDGLTAALERILAGANRGRTLVRLR